MDNPQSKLEGAALSMHRRNFGTFALISGLVFASGVLLTKCGAEENDPAAESASNEAKKTRYKIRHLPPSQWPHGSERDDSEDKTQSYHMEVATAACEDFGEEEACETWDALGRKKEDAKKVADCFFEGSGLLSSDGDYEIRHGTSGLNFFDEIKKRDLEFCDSFEDDHSLSSLRQYPEWIKVVYRGKDLTRGLAERGLVEDKSSEEISAFDYCVDRYKDSKDPGNIAYFNGFDERERMSVCFANKMLGLQDSDSEPFLDFSNTCYGAEYDCEKLLEKSVPKNGFLPVQCMNNMSFCKPAVNLRLEHLDPEYKSEL